MSPKKSTPMLKEFTKGFIVENPIFRLILGTCPTLAVTTSLKNGIGMGLAATFVLVGSNVAVSALRKVIPDKVLNPGIHYYHCRFCYHCSNADANLSASFERGAWYICASDYG